MHVVKSGRQPAVQVQLSVRRGREAEFYEAAFGAEEVYRFGGTDDYQESSVNFVSTEHHVG